ncbi:MAG: SAM-dependent methyltransferase [Pseudomonadota bacterium]
MSAEEASPKEGGKPAAQQTALEERLIEMIKLNGPISIADYIADALGHPHDGYYNSANAIGADGDFTTAPEISQIFGELIGLWLVDAWQAMGAPQELNLIELGPGRGVLMADILRAAQVRPEFAKAADIWLLETSGRLRHEQQKRLRQDGRRIHWADKFSDIPAAPALIVANEFFDCLPIRQFVRVKNGWRERLIGLTPSEDALAFTLAATPAAPDLPLPPANDAQEGDIFEFSDAQREFMADISRMLTTTDGRALIIDYGHIGAGLGDTLQAVRRHAFWPPLSEPGRADVTAHVDFAALARIAIENGAAVHGPITQGVFLERLGLAARVHALSSGKTAEEAATIHSGAHRIAAPSQMGEIFKAICVSAPNLPCPDGFDL